MIFLTSSSNPMSIILSASSKHRYLIHLMFNVNIFHVYITVSNSKRYGLAEIQVKLLFFQHVLEPTGSSYYNVEATDIGEASAPNQLNSHYSRLTYVR